MKKLILLVLVGLLIPVTVNAVPAPKYFVCKFTGTPGVSETLQTGQNPISVSGNALPTPIVIGGYFNDQHGRSLVVAEDVGQPEPTCPAPVNDPDPTDVCPNLDGVQTEAPQGYELRDGVCVQPDGDTEPGPTTDPEPEEEEPNPFRPTKFVNYPGVK